VAVRLCTAVKVALPETVLLRTGEKKGLWVALTVKVAVAVGLPNGAITRVGCTPGS
jgi:hypothetical protein